MYEKCFKLVEQRLTCDNFEKFNDKFDTFTLNLKSAIIFNLSDQQLSKTGNHKFQMKLMIVLVISEFKMLRYYGL